MKRKFSTKLLSAVLSTTIAGAGTLVCPLSASAQSVNPLSLEQTIINENFDKAEIKRPVTGSEIPARIEGTDKFTYSTTAWGSLARQRASIQDGAYHHTFYRPDDTYQFATVAKKLNSDVPLSLGDELHISFDYKFTNASGSQFAVIINDIENAAYTSIKSSVNSVFQHANRGKLIAFTPLDTDLTKTFFGFCGGKSTITIDPDKLYNVSIIIKTKDSDYGNKQTITANITSSDGTDIKTIGYLDADFKGVADQWGFISTPDTQIDPLKSFNSISFTFETPSAAGDMILDNVSVKKIRNGYDIKGDAVNNYGVIPTGFETGKATVSLATDVSYYNGNETSGNFIVTQFDKDGRFVDTNIKPVTISKSNRVVSQNIDIKSDTKKITAYFWDGKQKPLTAESDLAQGITYATGDNPNLNIDFSDLSAIECINKNDSSNIFTFGTEPAKFGRTSGNVYTISNNTTAIADETADKPYKAIKITPAQLYPKASDTTVLDLSFAMDALNANKTIKVSSYNENGTKGDMSELVQVKSNGRMYILGYPVKIKDTAITATNEKWYNVKLYINKADTESGTPNTFDAYLDGQLVLSDKAFPVNGDNFGKWYGFSEIEIGSTAQKSDSAYLQDKLYIGNISYGINNDAPINSVIDSNSPYYVNLIDNTKGVIYNGGQDFTSFVNKMKRDGITACEKVSDTYFKMTDAKGGDIYYKIVDLPEDLAKYSVSEVDINNKYNPDLSNYYEYEQPLVIQKGSPLDASFTLGNASTIDANGFIYADGDKFMLDKNTADKSDDTEIKFWGTNIAGNGAFPDSHEEAERMADNIAAAGFNLVRFHKFDGGTKPSLFGFSDDATKIDEESWDKFTYLLKCLKDHGIYYYIDQMVSMPASMYKNGVGNVKGLDDVTGLGSGIAPICYFNDQAIALQKEFSRMLLTKENTYTGMTLAQDPAFAMMDLKNEFTFQNYQWLTKDETTGEYTIKCKTYYDELCSKYTEWLKNKYPKNIVSSETRLKYAWGSNNYGYTVNGTKESLNTQIYFVRSAWYTSAARLNDEELFSKDIMDKYLTSMYTYLKNDVGVKCAITGNTLYSDAQPQVAHPNASKTDFADNHLYWGHPSGTLNTDGTDLAPFNRTGPYTTVGNISMLDADILTNSSGDKYVGNIGLIGWLASTRVSGKPYVISEWLECAGTLAHGEGPVMMSAFASLHKWNPLSFAWHSTPNYHANLEDGYISNLDSPFSFTEDPVQRSIFPASSIMFNRGDVQEAQSGYYVSYDSDSEIYIGQGTDKFGKTVWLGQHYNPNLSRHALIGKTGIKFYDVTSSATSDSWINDAATSYTNKELNGEAVTYTSSTGELITDLGQSIFKVNTLKSQAVTGYIGGKTVETKNLKLNVTNDFAAVMLTSLNDNSIANSNRILLSLVGNSRNHGQVLSEDGKYIKIGGDNTILTEQIVGTVTIKGVSGNYKVYSLNSDGSRKAEIAVTNNGDGTISFTLTRDTKAMNFEIVK